MLAALLPLFAVADSTHIDPAALKRAVRTYTAPFASADARAMAAWHDLNADGRIDALVLVREPDGCAAGCLLLVFEAMPDEDAEETGRYRIAAEIPAAQPAAHLVPAGHGGWCEVLVPRANGTASRFVFDGETYAPTPKPAPVAGKAVVFADL